MDSQPIEQVLRFSELQVSESGWGTFPSVYQIQDNNWVRLKKVGSTYLSMILSWFSSILESRTLNTSKRMISTI